MIQYYLGFATFSWTKPCDVPPPLQWSVWQLVVLFVTSGPSPQSLIFLGGRSWGVARKQGGLWHQGFWCFCDWEDWCLVLYFLAQLVLETRQNMILSCLPALPGRFGRHVNLVEVVLSQVITVVDPTWIIHWEGNDPCGYIYHAGLSKMGDLSTFFFSHDELLGFGCFWGSGCSAKPPNDSFTSLQV